MPCGVCSKIVGRTPSTGLAEDRNGRVAEPEHRLLRTTPKGLVERVALNDAADLEGAELDEAEAAQVLRLQTVLRVLFQPYEAFGSAMKSERQRPFCVSPPSVRYAQPGSVELQNALEILERHSVIETPSHCGADVAAEFVGGAAVTRQTALPTSSAISNAPVRSMPTPTGRPRVLASSERKPVTTSWGKPLGRPFWKGMYTTL